MAFTKTCFILCAIACTKCVALILSGLPATEEDVHTDFDPEGFGFGFSPPVEISPSFSADEHGSSYLQLPKQYKNALNYETYPYVVGLTPDVGQKCCENERTNFETYGGYFLGQLNEPVFQLDHGYLGNQFRDEDVKPVVEHIEDDIKYDFRTKTHYI